MNAMMMMKVTIKAARTALFIHASRRADGSRYRLGEQRFGKGRVGEV